MKQLIMLLCTCCICIQIYANGPIRGVAALAIASQQTEIQEDELAILRRKAEQFDALQPHLANIAAFMRENYPNQATGNTLEGAHLMLQSQRIVLEECDEEKSLLRNTIGGIIQALKFFVDEKSQKSLDELSDNGQLCDYVKDMFHKFYLKYAQMRQDIKRLKRFIRDMT